jgi:hypothetical protein
LDLARAGIKPNPRRLCTPTAKNKEIIHWANERSVADYAPVYVAEKWMPFFRKINKTRPPNKLDISQENSP